MNSPTPTECPSGCPFPAAFLAGETPTARVAGHHPDLDPVALAWHVLGVLRRTGKHFLPSSLLDRLDELRGETVDDPYLAAFLDCVLDKYDGRFQNRTYLALPVLEAMLDDPATGMDPTRLSAILMSDVIRFEVRAAAALPDGDRPDTLTLRRRLQHARLFVDHCLSDGPAAGAARPAPSTSGPLAGLPTPTGAVAEWLAATVQPVYVLHDEYFFIRALQCHELTFTVLVADIQAATRAVREGDPAAAAARLRHANEVLTRAALLFRIVATMRATTFHTFREFTQGASAIQSDQYKRFEAACGTPDQERLSSDAFAGVPVVRAEALAGQDTLTGACLDADRSAAAGWEALDAALGVLERSHQRWKTAHRGLAARMLGTNAGSGYTEGVPYLERCLGNRLFGPLGDQSAAA